MASSFGPFSHYEGFRALLFFFWGPVVFFEGCWCPGDCLSLEVSMRGLVWFVQPLWKVWGPGALPGHRVLWFVWSGPELCLWAARWRSSTLQRGAAFTVLLHMWSHLILSANFASPICPLCLDQPSVGWVGKCTSCGQGLPEGL